MIHENKRSGTKGEDPVRVASWAFVVGLIGKTQKTPFQQPAQDIEHAHRGVIDRA
jgi:hypothetical protein